MGTELMVIAFSLTFLSIGLVISLVQNYLQRKLIDFLLRENEDRVSNLFALKERVDGVELDRALHKAETENLKIQVRSKSFDEMVM